MGVLRVGSVAIECVPDPFLDLFETGITQVLRMHTQVSLRVLTVDGFDEVVVTEANNVSIEFGLDYQAIDGQELNSLAGALLGGSVTVPGRLVR